MSPDRLASSPPTPRQRGASMGSSGIENLSSSHFNQFSRHAKARLSANDPSSRLSSMSTASTSVSSSYADSDGFYAAHRGSDPLANDEYYAAQLKLGNFIKMGWLTKQGHMWKTWKTRFFVLFTDGTFAYYKNKGKKRMQGSMTLNDGIVTIKHVDIRKVGKPYVFQVEKGFYKLLCYGCSQLEVELWVTALRAARKTPAPCFEVDLTAAEEKAGVNAVTPQLNKIFVTDMQIAQSVDDFKVSTLIGHRADEVQNFIERLDDSIIDRHHLALYQDKKIEMLPGNELIKLIRRHVEDRVFMALYSSVYDSLDTAQLRITRSKAMRNIKLLSGKPQADFGIPDELSTISNWSQVAEIVNSLDCVSLPSHKIEIIIVAGMEILKTIAWYHGEFFDVSDETLSAIFRYVLVLSSADDMCILRALLRVVYKNHPACQTTTGIIESFLDAIRWIECYESQDNGLQSDGMSLSASRITVSISTKEIGIQFTTDGNGRGAIVYSIRKLSQAALSEAIIPGLSLIAINDEPVVLMPFREICRRLRSATLPKRLTFMTEFYYYQVLSLDTEMFQYLMCLAAARGDKDSAAWLYGCQVNVNELCSWGKARGKQVFGFKPPSGKSAPLFAAAYHGQGKMVEYLLGLGADPNVLNRKGRSPLHVVARTVDMAIIIEALVGAGAEIDAPDKKGLTPLMWMCSWGSMEGAATFLALGADIHKTAWSNGFTPLDFSVTSRKMELVDLCLSRGSDPNVQTFEGNTSLHIAAANGDSEIILRLIEAGADANIQNRYGQTAAAILLATPPGHVPRDHMVLCLEILACSGCRLDKRDMFGRQLFHLASQMADERLTQLVQRMARLSKVRDEDIDIYGYSAKDYAFFDEAGDKDMSFLIAQRPQDSWKVADGRSGGKSLTARSYRVDDLVNSLVHDVTVDFAEIVSFVLFLETFSSLNEVVERLKAQAWSKEKGRGLIRLFVMLLLFKEQHVADSEYVHERFYSLMQQFTGVDREKLASLVEEFKGLFHEYLALRGSEACLKQYNEASLGMEDMYNPYTHGFQEVFPAKLHRHTEPSRWAKQCTLLTHALFTSIPVEDFIKTSKQSYSSQFVCARRWFQHLSAYVINAVLLQDSSRERAEVVSFFLSLSVPSKKLLNEMQFLSDKGCREMNKSMRKASSPCMPYIGLYLQSFVGMNELPVFEKPGLVNANRLRKMGELVMEILRRRSVPYALTFDEVTDKLLHVSLPYDSDESRYARSLVLEPREAGAAPLSDRSSLTVEDLDLESEVRESIGSEGTFGIRQWLRKQKVVHRNRSRSSAQVAQHEWV
ncbi:hypothetical protein Gpo141_00001768 [Globisporangium polare]